MLQRRIFLRLSLITKKQYKTPKVSVGTAKKSIAGLWDLWRNPNNNVLETGMILRARPNSLVAEVHDRMPAILDHDAYERWLDPGITNPEVILDCLKPSNTTLMSKYPVSPRVHRPENDEEYAREVPAENSAPTLF
jgi:putative SOS response-associated peptidase YedK